MGENQFNSSQDREIVPVQDRQVEMAEQNQATDPNDKPIEMILSEPIPLRVPSRKNPSIRELLEKNKSYIQEQTWGIEEILDSVSDFIGAMPLIFQKYFDEAHNLANILVRSSPYTNSEYNFMFPRDYDYNNLKKNTGSLALFNKYIGFIIKDALPDVRKDAISPSNLRRIIQVFKEFDAFYYGFHEDSENARRNHNNTIKNFFPNRNPLGDLNLIAIPFFEKYRAVKWYEYAFALAKRSNSGSKKINLNRTLDLSEEEKEEMCLDNRLVFDIDFIDNEVINSLAIKDSEIRKKYMNMKHGFLVRALSENPNDLFPTKAKYAKHCEAKKFLNIKNSLYCINKVLQEIGIHSSNLLFPGVRDIFSRSLPKKVKRNIFFRYWANEKEKFNYFLYDLILEVTDIEGKIDGMNNRFWTTSVTNSIHDDQANETLGYQVNIKDIIKKSRGIIDYGLWSVNDKGLIKKSSVRERINRLDDAIGPLVALLYNKTK